MHIEKLNNAIIVTVTPLAIGRIDESMRRYVWLDQDKFLHLKSLFSEISNAAEFSLDRVPVFVVCRIADGRLVLCHTEKVHDVIAFPGGDAYLILSQEGFHR